MPQLLGCDLEYAVKSERGYIPAGLLPITGKKGSPEFIDTGGIEVDCCAVELTMPPSANRAQFVSTILDHLAAVREKYKKYGELVTVPSVKFTKVTLDSAPFASEMGCQADYNVWTKETNPPPESRNGLRTFGGHVHINKGTENTIKACDLTLGMWSVIADSDRDRRKLYGRAGAFRPKPYGVEYRVLSNFWCDKKENIELVWDLVEVAREMENKIDEVVTTVGGPDVIQNIINNSQVLRARFVLKTIGINL